MAKRKQKDRAVVDTFQPPIPTVGTCVVVLAPFATIDAQSASAGLGASWDIQERSFSPRFAARRDHGSARVALWEPACSCWYDAPHRTAPHCIEPASRTTVST
ncbi:hypothetical protein CFAM422_000318 [Trichoderma lentiforme]|uniref:Uncharacterized protein n=1 Tax=Trichoderma lentiforme TaxID=1567552 RepID=A0A9P4XRZ1_9HYPO|nr:hypothetical protein CFAM422_000318 [Trichoderma lentiforme]